MATTSNLRARRNAAQLHALADLKKDIRSQDTSYCRKYLREFQNSYRSYESVLTRHELEAEVRGADTVLIGDYHALAASQRFAAQLFESTALESHRPAVLAAETIFTRDQSIVDEWWRREIGHAELKERIRFDLDWGYEWEPFLELLTTVREHGDAIYGVDCAPREDLRKIGARDRHAAYKIKEIRRKHPRASIMVLFGESHLAPGHLPHQVRTLLPEENILTVLQNVDALYWRAAGEKQERVEAVRVSDDVVCAFNSTPLEKYESYRLHLSRWGRDEDSPELTPTIHNLIDSLVRFLGINRYSPHNTTQPKFLVDMMPEVCGGQSDERLSRLLESRGASALEVSEIIHQVNERGCVYLRSANAVYVRNFRMVYAAEEAARFLHHACRGLPYRKRNHGAASERAIVLEDALAYFGSRVLYPARNGDESGEREKPRAGYQLGHAIYDAYVRGKVSQSALRRMFLAHIENSSQADGLWREMRHKFLGL